MSLCCSFIFPPVPFGRQIKENSTSKVPSQHSCGTLFLFYSGSPKDYLKAPCLHLAIPTLQRAALWCHFWVVRFSGPSNIFSYLKCSRHRCLWLFGVTCQVACLKLWCSGSLCKPLTPNLPFPLPVCSSSLLVLCLSRTCMIQRLLIQMDLQ